MADWGKVWTENELSSFLEDPMKARPGTKMGYAGIKNDQERLALIKFLAAAAVNSDLCVADN
jgi:cytochrome c